MKIFFFALLFIVHTTLPQQSEIVYALNEGVTTKEVKEGVSIKWGATKPFPNSSYIKIKQKSLDTFYIQTTVNGQFAYGHYFKFKDKNEGGFRYIRTDGNEIEYLIVNYSLNELSSSNQYDEKVILKLINYRTSFAMLFKF